MLLAALLAALLYLWIRDEYGQIAGVAAVAALFTMPRFFFHAHLSSLGCACCIFSLCGYLFILEIKRPHEVGMGDIPWSHLGPGTGD